MGAPPTTGIVTDTAGYTPINDQPDLVPLIQEAVPDGVSESPDSPVIELGEHCSVTRIFQGGYDVLFTMLRFPGTLVRDSLDNYFRTLTSNLKHKKGNRSVLTIVDEWVAGQGLVPPPDEFDIEPIEFNPAIEKNPLWTIDATGNGDVLTDEDIMRIKQAVDAPQPLGRTDNANNPYPGTTQGDLWDALLQKLRRGEDTYYLAGFKIMWTRCYPTPVSIDPGGYTQTPGSDVTGDIVPSFFIRNSFQQLILPSDAQLAWLREADKFSFQRTWFKVTRTWICGPNGQWDPDIYPDYFDPAAVPDTATDTNFY